MNQNASNIIMGLIVWFWVLFLVFIFRPRKIYSTRKVGLVKQKDISILALVCIGTVFFCIIPMGMSPYYNGEIPDHRNQYEKMAEALLEGHVYLNDEVDQSLLSLSNPYNPKEREESQAEFLWDHAYYNGHYYMYFGIAPVIFLFLPYKVLTGTTLLTYHATQIFVLFIIVGIFALNYLFAKTQFQNCSFGYLCLISVGISLMSVWLSIGEPALYCTAITSGICCEIWSIYFFVKCLENNDDETPLYAIVGSFLGALTFACRPPIGLTNIIVIPVLKKYMSISKKGKVRRFLQIAIPYMLVAVLLMMYNHARFDNPFEFGQAYQLTVADQHLYGGIRLLSGLKGLLHNFVASGRISGIYSFYSNSGVLCKYPMTLAVFGLISRDIRMKLKEKNSYNLVIILMLAALIITFFEAQWVPFWEERYRMDVYYIVGIFTFIIIEAANEVLIAKGDGKIIQIFKKCVWIMTILCILMTIGLILIPHNQNYTSYNVIFWERVVNILTFGRR